MLTRNTITDEDVHELTNLAIHVRELLKGGDLKSMAIAAMDFELIWTRNTSTEGVNDDDEPTS